MLQQLLAIARNTFVESIRQPVFMVLILVAGFMLVLNPFLASYTFEDDNKMLIDMGLSVLFLAGVFFSAFSATNAISNEIENKTVLTVISKPVSRPLFIVGKFLGVGGAIGVAYWILAVVFLLTVRHRVQQTASDRLDMPVVVFGVLAVLLAAGGATLANYFYRWVFTSTFIVALLGLMTTAWLLVLNIDKRWGFQTPLTDLNPQLMIGLALIFQSVLILTAIAIVASTRLGQIMTLLVCLGAFLLGLVSEYFLGNLVRDYAWFLPFYVVTPNFQILWPGDALTQGHDFSAQYFGLVSLYGGLMVTAMLSLAVCLFQTRDVG